MTFENIEVSHLRHALRGMRNPMSGWDKSDTKPHYECPLSDGPIDKEAVMAGCDVGPSDMRLAKALISGGQPHRKFMRQISVIVDICKMPAYFMHEFATYKVGTTSDSSSTMHRITSRDLTADDFEAPETDLEKLVLGDTIVALNTARRNYLVAKEDGDTDTAEQIFRSIKRMLPHSYLYERVTWTCSYENLIEIWRWRHNHRLPAWHVFCKEFIEKLPYASWITQHTFTGSDNSEV